MRRRGERGGRRSRSRPESKRQDAEGGVRAHCGSISEWTLVDGDCDEQLAYLDLQNVVATNPLVMHVVVGIISITAVLVLHKRKPDLVVSNQYPAGCSGIEGMYAYSLLEADRGAGMSQRTSLP